MTAPLRRRWRPPVFALVAALMVAAALGRLRPRGVDGAVEAAFWAGVALAAAAAGVLAWRAARRG